MNTQTTAMATTQAPPTVLAPIEDHLYSTTLLAQFRDVLGKENAIPYIRSVLIAVEQGSWKLQQCTPMSIGIAALRSATLGLSLDPAVKQAYLIPYNNTKYDQKTNRRYKQYEASFAPHYLGLYTLAIKTNLYSRIDVFPISNAYTVERDLMTGDDAILRVSDGQRMITLPKTDPKEAWIWFGYLRTVRGFTHSEWMTVDEIAEHTKTFNSYGYDEKDSLWNHADHKATMQKKTVLRKLLDFAVKTTNDTTSRLAQALQVEAEVEEHDPDVVDAEPTQESTPIVVQSTTPPPMQKAPAGPQEAPGATQQPQATQTTEKPASSPAAQNASSTTMDGGADPKPASILDPAPGDPAKLLQIKLKAQRDPVTAYWELKAALGIDKQEAQAILKERGNDFKLALETLIKNYSAQLT